MPQPAPRRFLMTDLMILVAGAAAGLAWTRAHWRDSVPMLADLGGTLRLPYLLEAAHPALASIGLALLACRLRRPRPPLRRLARSPGSVALAGMALAYAAEAAIRTAGLALGHAAEPTGRAIQSATEWFWPAPDTFGATGVVSYSVLQSFTAVDPGPSIAACWLLLLALGRWRTKPTWLDRSGRCLGACWIALSLASRLVSASLN